ncbi:SGNH/GDSL hydrolase family protein [Flavihumibacter profundi]|uniref:SGNH/GDSL hydrolase family protein n=1 Tax=Flavihumibacter profundi TaxID=2716883 RepID=UPI001CC82B58|nr:GDSL-type esterase/lipase family protein [Flavihumibacter profundi]MBZ5856221.1 GDSL-type esterase/lipase family protein [Flavihumibacter profundi]
MHNYYTYLALGDSYTIGEQVLLTESFPYQLVQLFRKQGFFFTAPEIIAKTGWTTDELLVEIEAYSLLPHYDLVSLLIGVNNQYRQRPVEIYIKEFEVLIKKAIQFAGNRPGHVTVLSIPDWGVTPFAEGRDRDQISRDIDSYNNINLAIANLHRVKYIEITRGTREAAHRPELLASDQLHPSSVEYQRWAVKIAKEIQPVR